MTTALQRITKDLFPVKHSRDTPSSVMDSLYKRRRFSFEMFSRKVITDEETSSTLLKE
jgi:hypothetical protein